MLSDCAGSQLGPKWCHITRHTSHTNQHVDRPVGDEKCWISIWQIDHSCEHIWKATKKNFTLATNFKFHTGEGGHCFRKCLHFYGCQSFFESQNQILVLALIIVVVLIFLCTYGVVFICRYCTYGVDFICRYCTYGVAFICRYCTYGVVFICRYCTYE